MGWKTLKERFGIQRHTIRVEDGSILIGSGFVSNLISINMRTGTLTENPTFKGGLKDVYPALLNATPDELLEQINKPDSFAQSLTVWMVIADEVVEKKVEEFGYPHPTHDGVMQYENNSFATRKEALARSVESLEIWEGNLTRYVAELEQKLANEKAQLANVELKLTDARAQLSAESTKA
jgi:hypothetical protein